jgi:hypothetical protein
VRSPLGIDGDPKNKIIAAEVNGIVDAIPTKALRTIISAKKFRLRSRTPIHRLIDEKTLASTDTLVETLATLTNARLNDHVLSHTIGQENEPSATSLTRLDWQFVDAHKLVAKGNESKTTYVIDIK